MMEERRILDTVLVIHPDGSQQVCPRETLSWPIQDITDQIIEKNPYGDNRKARRAFKAEQRRQRKKGK